MIRQRNANLKKTRPWLVISPDEMSHAIGTVIIAPMKTKSHPFPTRIELPFENEKGWIVLDQIRTINASRLIRRLGKIGSKTKRRVKDTLRDMLVD